MKIKKESYLKGNLLNFKKGGKSLFIFKEVIKMEQKLKKISLHLLDLGKRNRLLNYKDSGLRTIDVLNSNIETIFQKVTGSSKLSIFALDSVLTKYEKTIEGNNEKKEEYSILKVKDIAEPFLKANDILCYKKGICLEKVLKTIEKEYKLSLIERGINTLYMTFGLVEYKDKKDIYDAPLLLIPIEMKSDNGKYFIHEAEDEVFLNPTLSYLLKTEYSVVLEEYDEQKTDFIAYFSKLSKLLKESDMNLKIHASIGIYSFLKMNMFNDINENSSIVLENKNILRLLGERVEEDSFFNADTYPVVGADSSQLEAIAYAAGGSSFVLQGPPGSGKSQTITNIISTMIGNSKKVLFVSEKQAALNVVYENLRRAGLESFALELHSHKANKKEFIDELYKTACLPHYDIKNDAFNMEEKYQYLSEKLSSYRDDIHRHIKRLNMSLFDLFSEYLKFPKYDDLNYYVQEVGKQTLTDLDEVKQLCSQYIKLSLVLGENYHQGPFYGFCCEDQDFIRYQAKNAFLELQKYLHEQFISLEQINQLLPLNLKSYSDLIHHMDLLNHFVGLHFYLPEYFIKTKRNQLLEDLKVYLDTNKMIEKSTIAHFIDLDILNHQPADLLYQLKLSSRSKFRWLLPSYRHVKKELSVFTKIKMKNQDLIEKLEEALVYQKNQSIVDETSRHLPRGYRIYEYEQMYQDLIGLKDISFDLIVDEKKYQMIKVQLLDILMKYHKETFVLKNYIPYFDSAVIDLIQGDLSVITKKIDRMNESVSILDTHAQRLEVINQLKERNVLPLLDEILNSSIDLKQLPMIYEARWWLANLYFEMDLIPQLKAFVNTDIDGVLEEFKNLEQGHLEANKAMIVSKLSKLRPDDSIMAGSKFSILIKEYNKLRKQKPIRILLEEILDLIFDIKPVFLMSPLSVSTYLPSKLDLFDLVIFDEASQVFAWDALGAIYRAKQCIVIGDSKQMPPTNFFTSRLEEDEESFEDELESILDKASGIFRTKRLNWHYRSRSEELIAFSNDAFYNHMLITVPQAKAHEKGFGIDFCYLPEGVYEAKSRTNVIEAQKIVELVFEHFDQYPNESLGVVAFSNTQAELIDDLIAEALKNRTNYQKFFNESQDEPFFVKNLETVQGDERDAIIFSICYGYNSEHKFYQRFGPLNNIGGERRLNVAITRAKYNICVVSSILSTDIRLEHTDSLGVKLLKEYLDYAEHITTPQHDVITEADGVSNAISNYLKNNGFLVEQNVGNSSFKIDIAVVHPATKEYVVAIMLDGDSYKIGNVSDVNYLQEVLLKRLGWQFYRIFSTLWIQNQEQEQKKLFDFVTKALLLDQDSSNEVQKETIDLLVENEDELSDEFPSYPLVSEENIKKLYQTKKTYQIIDYIVSKEEPIHIDYLLKRICFMYGRTKVTNIVKELFEKDLEKLNLIQKDSFLMKHYNGSLELRIGGDRMIEQVHPEELKDAIYKIVKRSNGITKEGCFRSVVKLLGYNRMSENAVNYLEDALVLLKLDGKIVEKQECLYV